MCFPTLGSWTIATTRTFVLWPSHWGRHFSGSFAGVCVHVYPWVCTFLSYILPTCLALLVSFQDFECWCVLICWGAQKGVSTPQFFGLPALPEQTQPCRSEKAWIRRDRSTYLTSLTTRSHLNHYTISQVSFCKHLGLDWKNPTTVFIRQPGSIGRVCTCRCMVCQRL